MNIRVTCPRGHASELTFSKDKLAEELSDGSFTWWCFHCDERWPPSADEKAGIARQLE